MKNENFRKSEEKCNVDNDGSEIYGISCTPGKDGYRYSTYRGRYGSESENSGREAKTARATVLSAILGFLRSPLNKA